MITLSFLVMLMTAGWSELHYRLSFDGGSIIQNNQRYGGGGAILQLSENKSLPMCPDDITVWRGSFYFGDVSSHAAELMSLVEGMSLTLSHSSHFVDHNLTHNKRQLQRSLSRDLELALVEQGLYAVRTLFCEQIHEKSLSSHHREGIVLPTLPPQLWLPHSHNPCYQLVIPSYGTIVNLPLDVIQIVDNFDSEYH